jgi:hypothetical protein
MPDRPALGSDIAHLLTGVWRAQPPGLALSAERLAAVSTILQGTGAGGLGWWRLRSSPLRDCLPAQRLQQAYRLHALGSAGHEQCLASIVTCLRGADIEPIIVKGWSISRRYPAPGLRPYGDVDVCVPPEQVAATLAILQRERGRVGIVDVHAGVADLDDRTLEALQARTQLVPLGELPIRVLGPEDQLRHLALHLMRHGAWRPLWLCDLAVMLEGLPAGFDWDCCLRGQPVLRDWVVAALGLAGRLLDANVQPVGPLRGAFNARWLANTVLGLWSLGADANDAVTVPLSACLHSGQSLRRALRQRWPNPIRAAFKLGVSPFARWPRPLVQAAAFAGRGLQYLRDFFRPAGPAAGAIAVHPLRVR